MITSRLFILHSNELLRQGLVTMLTAREQIVVLGDTSEREVALGLCRTLRPHVGLIECTDVETLENCRVLHAAHPSLPLVLLGATRDLAVIMRAFRAGATIYVPSDVTLEGLLHYIEEAHRQGREAGPCLARAARPLQPQPCVVSRREREVLALISQGKANKEIGRALAISENTVRNHIANIFGKLGVTDRTEAAVLAIKRGLL